MEYREVWAEEEADLSAPRAVPVALPVKEKERVRTCRRVAFRTTVPRTHVGVKKVVRTGTRGSYGRATW